MNKRKQLKIIIAVSLFLFILLYFINFFYYAPTALLIGTLSFGCVLGVLVVLSEFGNEERQKIWNSNKILYIVTAVFALSFFIVQLIRPTELRRALDLLTLSPLLLVLGCSIGLIILKFEECERDDNENSDFDLEAYGISSASASDEDVDINIIEKKTVKENGGLVTYIVIALPQVFKKIEDAAPKTQRLIEQLANQGYELVEIKTRSILQQPGCIAGLMGRKESFFKLDTAVFRK